MKVILLYLAALFILILPALFMKRRKEKTELKNLPNIVKKVDVYELRKGWYNHEAKYIYRLYSGQLIVWSDGQETMNTSMEQGERLYHDDEGWRSVSDGDLAWARKIAKHYGIDVPTKATE